MHTPGFWGRNFRWLLPLLILLGSIVLLIGMAQMRQKPPAKPPADNTTLVETRTIDLSPLQIHIKSQGLVKAKYATDLVAQVSGEVIELAPAFVRGGLVKKGEVLARIDPTNYEVALENARAGLASAEAALEQEIAQSEVAKVEWEEVNDREAPALGLRKPQLEQARARVVAARAELKLAQKNLERTQIKAPYDALISERLVSLGSFLNVGAKLGQVMDVSRAEIRLPVATADLRYLPNLGVGVDVTLTADTGGVEHLWMARIVRSEGVIDENSRMHYLVAEVSDPYNLINPQTDKPDLAFGSFVVAQLAGIRLPSAVQVNRSLVRDGKVAVYRDGKLQFKTVDIVRNFNGKSIIASGLAAGDALITTALEFPVEGMALRLKDQADTVKETPSTLEQGDA